jgi:hypothetical protein
LLGSLRGTFSTISTQLGHQPYAAGQFTTFDLPAYAEQAIVGANTFALAYSAESVTAAGSEVGVRTDKCWAMSDSIFTLACKTGTEPLTGLAPLTKRQ